METGLCLASRDTEGEGDSEAPFPLSTGGRWHENDLAGSSWPGPGHPLAESGLARQEGGRDSVSCPAGGLGRLGVLGTGSC